MYSEVLGVPVYTVSFFGCKNFTRTPLLEQRLEALILSLLKKRHFVVFLVGRTTAFDLFAASVIHRCRQASPPDSSALVWVCPLPLRELRESETAPYSYYTEIEPYRSDFPGNPKFAQHQRDVYMLSRSDLAVFCPRQKDRRPWRLLQYAMDARIPAVNINRPSIWPSESQTSP